MILIRLTGNNIVQKKIFRHLILKKNLEGSLQNIYLILDLYIINVTTLLWLL